MTLHTRTNYHLTVILTKLECSSLCFCWQIVLWGKETGSATPEVFFVCRSGRQWAGVWLPCQWVCMGSSMSTSGSRGPPRPRKGHSRDNLWTTLARSCNSSSATPGPTAATKSSSKHVNWSHTQLDSHYCPPQLSCQCNQWLERIMWLSIKCLCV